MAQNQPKNPEKHSTYMPKKKKSTKPFHKTPLLDQLESGPWPSFVTGLKRLAHDNNMMVDLLGQLEHYYTHRKGYWKWGSGLIAVHGQTGNIMFIGTTSENTQHFFDEINEYGWDLGGAGPCVRTALSGVGGARCTPARAK